MLFAVLSGFVLAVFAPWLPRLTGRATGWCVALLPLGLCAYWVSLVPNITQGETVHATYVWVTELGLGLSLYLDGLSLLFAILITGVGALVCIYAGGYLGMHRQLGVFYACLLAFMAAMLGLVLAGNLLTLYVFWELTTLTSFLLIGFEHGRESARAAALQALLVTALGGLAMLAGLILLGVSGGSFELPDLFERADVIRGDARYIGIVALVLMGAFTKSAQFPFHFWLPNAMEAPTPVSAYLHSATMVKAGVYLVARLTPVLGGTVAWNGAITIAGAVTMLLGACLAYGKHDMKSVLAYLTVNALGTLMMLLGLGTELGVQAAIVYLVAHAAYKGALFLVTGAVDHETHTRDLRELGGLGRRMPVSAAAAVFAGLSMAGVLPFLGFVGKELYLEAVWSAPRGSVLLTIVTVLASAFLVAGAALVVIHPFFRRSSARAEHAHEAGVSLWLGPLLLSAVGLVLGLAPGRFAGPLLQSAVSAVWGRSVQVELALWHGLTLWLALSTAAVAAGIALYVFRARLLEVSARIGWIPAWSGDRAYHQIVAGLNSLAVALTRLLQSGYLRVYVTIILLTTVLLVALMISHVGLPFLERAGVGVRIWEVVAAGLILAATATVVRSTSRFQAIASLGVIGFGVAWLFHLFGAPDLAMTQLVVETLTVVLFVLAFYHLPQFSLLSSTQTRVRDAALALSVGSLITALLLLVTSFPQPERISEYYAENSVPLAHGANVVNVILVDFRALDTLGEITVLATAALGVATLLKFSWKGRQTS